MNDQAIPNNRRSALLAMLMTVDQTTDGAHGRHKTLVSAYDQETEGQVRFAETFVI